MLRGGAVRVPWTHALFFLFLISVSQSPQGLAEAVREPVGSAATSGNQTDLNKTDLIIAGHIGRADGDDRLPLPLFYDPKPIYKQVGALLTFALVIFSVLIYHDNLLQLSLPPRCSLAEKTPLFEKIERMHRMGGSLRFLGYSRVLMTYDDCHHCPREIVQAAKKEKGAWQRFKSKMKGLAGVEASFVERTNGQVPRLVPFTKHNTQLDGYMAFVVVTDPSTYSDDNEVTEVTPGTLVVAINCAQLGGGTGRRSMRKLLTQLEDNSLGTFLDSENLAGGRTLKTVGISIFMLKPQDGLIWCPNQYEFVELIPKEMCHSTYTLGGGFAVSGQRWIDRATDRIAKIYEGSITNISSLHAENSSHVHFGKGAFRTLHMKDNSRVSSVTLAVVLLIIVCGVGVWTGWVLMGTAAHGRFEDVHKDDTYYGHLMRGDYFGVSLEEKLGDTGFAISIFSGVFILVAIILLASMTEILLKFAFSRVIQRSARFSSHVTSIVEACILIVCITAPAMIFLKARDVGGEKATPMLVTIIVSQWASLFLSLIFFSDAMVKLGNHWFGTTVHPMTTPVTASVILGMVGIVNGIVSFTEAVRNSHGYDAGCWMSELGLTFRNIARQNPAALPKGSDFDLTCPESNLTFSQVFDLPLPERRNNNSVIVPANVAKDELLDDGNICIFTCTVKKNDKQRITTYPIYCKKNGFYGNRWTLSDFAGAQQNRLCRLP